jgi:hypothetical protein
MSNLIAANSGSLQRLLRGSVRESARMLFKALHASGRAWADIFR